MATLLSVFSASELTMRFKQPFLTEGLNEKMAVNTPPGCYRGLRLGTSGSNNTVTVVADVDHSDHVAVYQTSAGRSISIRKTGGDISINLSALVDGALEKTWVLAIFAQYTIGSVSAAEIRAYELDPVDEFTIAPELGELVILGQVKIPAASASPLPAGNITHTGRSYAWAAQAPEAADWYPVIRNGGFEFSWDDSLGDFPHSSAYWSRERISGDGSWETDQSDPRTGNKALAWRHSTTQSSATAEQMLNIAVSEGQALRYQFFKKVLKVPLGGGTVFIEFDWSDASGGAMGSTSLVIDTDAIDAAYVEVEGTVLVPTGAGYLVSVGFRNLFLDFGSAGIGYLIDDANVWMEGARGRKFYGEDRIGTLEGTGMVLHRPDDPTNFLVAAGAVVEYDFNEGQSAGALKILSPKGDAAEPSPALIQVASTLGGDEYTLIKETQVSGEKQHREYVSPTGEFVRTINAKWDNTTNLWTKDINGQTASKANQNNLIPMATQTQIAGTNSWADGAWVDPPLRRSVYQPICAFDGSANYSIGYATINGSDTYNLCITAGLYTGDIIESVTFSYQSDTSGGTALFTIYASHEADDIFGASGDPLTFVFDNTDRTLVHTLSAPVTMAPGIDILFRVNLTGTSGAFYLYSVSADIRLF
jgi:hypothetical protein